MGVPRQSALFVLKVYQANDLPQSKSLVVVVAVVVVFGVGVGVVIDVVVNLILSTSCHLVCFA